MILRLRIPSRSHVLVRWPVCRRTAVGRCCVPLGRCGRRRPERRVWRGICRARRLRSRSRLAQTPRHNVLGALIGGTVGLAARPADRRRRSSGPNTDDPRVVFLHTLHAAGRCPYIGLVLGAKGEWLEPARLDRRCSATPDPQRRYRILDTSVIIDGRIADICETGFSTARWSFRSSCCKELQQVADSSDSLKRNRGRRGLDILQSIQKMAGVDVMISDVDFPGGHAKWT